MAPRKSSISDLHVARDPYVQKFEASFGSLFNDPELSDAVIEVDTYRFQVHKVILAA